MVDGDDDDDEMYALDRFMLHLIMKQKEAYTKSMRSVCAHSRDNNNTKTIPRVRVTTRRVWMRKSESVSSPHMNIYHHTQTHLCIQICVLRACFFHSFHSHLQLTKLSFPHSFSFRLAYTALSVIIGLYLWLCESLSLPALSFSFSRPCRLPLSSFLYLSCSLRW